MSERGDDRGEQGYFVGDPGRSSVCVVPQRTPWTEEETTRWGDPPWATRGRKSTGRASATRTCSEVPGGSVSERGPSRSRWSGLESPGLGRETEPEETGLGGS